MKLSYKGIELIQHYEQCRLSAYQDSVGIWTIAWGNTYYEDGTPVKQGDTVTQDSANQLFHFIADEFVEEVNYLLAGVTLKQQQFDALISFTYNEGERNLKESTLLKKVYANPNDATIPGEFMKWVYAGGVKLDGLVNRRNSEAYLYETGEVKFFN